MAIDGVYIPRFSSIFIVAHLIWNLRSYPFDVVLLVTVCIGYQVM